MPVPNNRVPPAQTEENGKTGRTVEPPAMRNAAGSAAGGHTDSEGSCVSRSQRGDT